MHKQTAPVRKPGWPIRSQFLEVFSKMGPFCSITLFFCVGVYGKALHVKEVKYNDTDVNYDDEIKFIDFYNSGDSEHIPASKVRYARHIELVTETALEHVLSEIEKKYSRFKNNTRSAIPKLVKQLKMKLKYLNKMKLKKHKIKKSHRPNKTSTVTLNSINSANSIL